MSGLFEVLQLLYRTKVFISGPAQNGGQPRYYMTQRGAYI